MFEVRRPLVTKEGYLFFNTGWLHFTLKWPNLAISDSSSRDSFCYHFPLEVCTFSPAPELDKSISDERCFCILVRNNCSFEEYHWFTQTQDLRREWCFLLRKYSAHHNLKNCFHVSILDIWCALNSFSSIDSVLCNILFFTHYNLMS